MPPLLSGLGCVILALCTVVSLLVWIPCFRLSWFTPSFSWESRSRWKILKMMFSSLTVTKYRILNWKSFFKKSIYQNWEFGRHCSIVFEHLVLILIGPVLCWAFFIGCLVSFFSLEAFRFIIWGMDFFTKIYTARHSGNLSTYRVH